MIPIVAVLVFVVALFFVVRVWRRRAKSSDDVNRADSDAILLQSRDEDTTSTTKIRADDANSLPWRSLAPFLALAGLIVVFAIVSGVLLSLESLQAATIAMPVSYYK